MKYKNLTLGIFYILISLTILAAIFYVAILNFKAGSWLGVVVIVIAVLVNGYISGSKRK